MVVRRGWLVIRRLTGRRLGQILAGGVLVGQLAFAASTNCQVTLSGRNLGRRPLNDSLDGQVCTQHLDQAVTQHIWAAAILETLHSARRGEGQDESALADFANLSALVQQCVGEAFAALDFLQNLRPQPTHLGEVENPGARRARWIGQVLGGALRRLLLGVAMRGR